jgi:molybdopterin-binding protein
MAEITMDVEAGSIVAAITDSSRERLNLQDGDQVTVVVKSTEVMIAKSGGSQGTGTRGPTAVPHEPRG